MKNNEKCERQTTADQDFQNVRPVNEAARLRIRTRLLKISALLAGGLLLTASMPPLDLSFTAWIAIIPLFWIASETSPAKAALCGFIWGVAHFFTSFYWLREIEWFIPYLIAPTLALWLALWAFMVPVIRRNVVYPKNVILAGHDAVSKYNKFVPWRQLLCAFSLAAWWCLIEWSRSNILPWNYLSTSQWRNLSLIQMCSVTGTYGVSFMIALINFTLAMAIRNTIKQRGANRYPRPVPLFLALFLLMTIVISGSKAQLAREQTPKCRAEMKAALIQGDISQRRQASDREAQEAMEVYLQLSNQIAASKPKPDIIIWPETAVPYPFKADHWLCRQYRYFMYNLARQNKLPVLFGTIDYELVPKGEERAPGTLNSAFLLGEDGLLKSKYDKVHPVPFGEYIPFRRYLPRSVVTAIGMGRDLTAGASFAPLRIHPGIKAGISICFEDVFPYISRRETLNGANLLLVISNDAWYPTSSEPVQHLANAVFRAVETGLPMLRSGNNSASCLIAPTGRISACLYEKEGSDGGMIPAPEIRGRRAGIIKVTAPLLRAQTIHTRFGGKLFVGICWLLFLAGAVYAACAIIRRKKYLYAKFK